MKENKVFTPTCKLTGRIKATWWFLPVIGWMVCMGCSYPRDEVEESVGEMRKRCIRMDTFGYIMSADSMLLCPAEFDRSELHGEIMEFICTGWFGEGKLRERFMADPAFLCGKDVALFTFGECGKLYFVKYIGDFPLVYTTEVVDGEFRVKRFLDMGRVE